MSGPKRARQVSAGRLYEWRQPGAAVTDVERYWSVTTIIDKSSSKQALVGWAGRTVAEYAVANIHRLKVMLEAVTAKKDEATGIVLVSDPGAVQGAIDWLKGCTYRMRDQKADAGTIIHAHAEAYMKKQPFPPAPEDVRGKLAAFQKYLVDWSPKYEAAEASVFNRTFRYAGTLDSIVQIPGIGRCLVDYKTGSGVYAEAGLQCAAYRNAEFIGRPDGREEKMPVIDATFVLHLRDDGYSLIPVRSDEPVWKSFRHAIEMFRWVEEIVPTVVGSELDPPLPPETPTKKPRRAPRKKKALEELGLPAKGGDASADPQPTA